MKRIIALAVLMSAGLAARGQALWSDWQQDEPVAVRTLCTVDSSNTKHSTVNAQVQNIGSDTLLVKGRGVNGRAVLAPGESINISFSQSKSCTKNLDFKLDARESRDDNGSYRIAYKQGRLQSKYHGSNMQLFGAMLQGAAAGLSGGTVPNYTASPSEDQ